MSMASEVMKLFFAALDVSFNSGHYTVIIRRQFLCIIVNNMMSRNRRKQPLTVANANRRNGWKAGDYSCEKWL